MIKCLNEIYLPWIIGITVTISPTDQSKAHSRGSPGLFHVSEWAGDIRTEHLGRTEKWWCWWLSSNDQNAWNSTQHYTVSRKLNLWHCQSVSQSVPAVAGDVVEVVEACEEVDPIWWLQGTGAVWHEEQEESLSSQLERRRQTLPLKEDSSNLTNAKEGIELFSILKLTITKCKSYSPGWQHRAPDRESPSNNYFRETFRCLVIYLKDVRNQVQLVVSVNQALLHSAAEAGGGTAERRS